MSWLRGVALGLMLAVIALASLTARVVVDGRREMRASDAAFNQGQLRDSLDHARRAAVLYAPGAPHVRAAYDRLTAIAVGAESTGHPRTAEMAWRAVRGAALETRHLWIPHRAELGRANENLARLQALAEGSQDPKQLHADQQRAMADLERDTAPRAQWVLVLGLGFALTATGLAIVALRGVGAGGELLLERARLGVLLAVIGVVCWVLAVWQA